MASTRKEDERCYDTSDESTHVFMWTMKEHGMAITAVAKAWNEPTTKRLEIALMRPQYIWGLYSRIA